MQQDKRTDLLFERVMQVVDRQLGMYSIRPNSRFLDLYVLNDRNFSWSVYDPKSDILTKTFQKCLTDSGEFHFHFSLGSRKFSFPNDKYSVPMMERHYAYERMFHCIVYACSTTFVPWTVWLDVYTNRGFKNEIQLMQSYMRQLISEFDTDEQRKAFEGMWIYDRGPRYVSEKDDIFLLPIPDRDEMEKTFSDILNGGDPPEPVPEANYVIVKPGGVTFLVSNENKYMLQILSNVSWTVTGGSDWCTFTPSSGQGDSIVYLTISENKSVNDRQTTITITGAEAQTRTIEVKQPGHKEIPPKLSVSPTSIIRISDAGTEKLRIYANVEWEITGTTTWCTVNHDEGKGNKLLTLTFTENTDTVNQRSTNLTIRPTSETGVSSVTVSITQLRKGEEPGPTDKYLNVSQTSVELDSLAQSYQITVTANVGWTVQVGDEPVVEYYLDVDKTAITVGYKASTEYAEDKRSIAITSNASWKAYAEGDKTGFEAMLDNFQSILPRQVTSNSATWRYLEAAYNTAESEWTSDALGLFSSDNFQEVYKGSDYHGNVEDYKETAHTSLQAWLMASCLAELVPESGMTDNRQSKLFKKAYELAGGRSTPIYGGFAIKADPMIARLVAGAIYAYNRHNYSFSDIDAMRSEVGGSPIDLTTTWTDVTEVYKMGYTSETNIGYNYASNDIFPSAAGPYSENYTRKETQHPSEQTDGQPSDQFYPASGNTDVWYNRNYKIDVAVDNIVVERYCLDAVDEYLERTVQAVADDSEKPKHRFGNKTYYTCGPVVSGRGLRDTFVPATPTTSGAKYFDGVFSETVLDIDLSDQITDASGNYTTFKKFFDMLRHGSVARQQLYEHQLGRRRPAQGTSENTARSTSNYHLCWLDDESIYKIDGGGTKRNEDGSSNDWYVDVNGNGRWESSDEPVSGDVYSGTATNLFPSQVPSTTYPSGHSAGVWVTALFLIQMLPSRIRQIFKAAYSYSVSRTIVRAHWNSDVMYGRTIGTMMPPLINAVRDTSNSSNDFRQIYSQIYAIVTGDTPVPPGPTPTPTPGSNQIAIVLTNNMSKDAIFNGYLRLTINGAASGDICFRKNRYYPYTQDAQWWTYHDVEQPDGTKKKEPYDGYMFGANTEKLTPGQSLSIIYTKRMENHSSSYVTEAQNISDLFGLSFKQTTSDKGNIKLSISIDRSANQPKRVDQYPNYYWIYFVDKNGNRVSGDQQIVGGGVYYLSIESGEPSADWDSSWNIMPYSQYTSVDELSSSQATVSY